MRRYIIMIVVLLAALTVACSSDDNGGGVVPVGECLDFLFTARAAENIVTSSHADQSTCDLAAVDVAISGIDDVFAVSFTFNYDSSVVRYAGFSTTGSVLSSDGVPLEILVDPQPDHVTVGLTRVGSTGIDTPGPPGETLVTLLFSRATDSITAATATYSNTEVIGSEEPPVAKPGIEWFAGTFVVR